MSVPVVIIAAVAKNGVIGSDNAMPWRLPSDSAHFMRTTMGKPIVMGRKTFESIGQPLKGRTSIVVTRNEGYAPEGVLVVNDLDVGLAWAQQIAAKEGASEVFVGGGGEIYREAMPLADRLFITHVDAEPPGNVRFPEIDPAVWEAVEELDVRRTERDSAAFRVKVYARKAPAVR